MNSKTFKLAGCFAALAFSGFAFDADTIAFYPFNEGSAGESVVGKSVANGVGQQYGGTSETVGAGTSSDLVYDEDVPGKYLYNEFYRNAPVLSSTHKSILFKSSTKNNAGAKISFADIGPAISGDSDYTIEFFFKIPEEEALMAKNWGHWLTYNCGMHCDSTKSGNGSTTAGLVEAVWYIDGSGKFYGFCGDMNNFDSTVTMDFNPIDGKWHHFAFVHNASDKTFNTYIDYGKAFGGFTGDNHTKNVVDYADEASGPLEMNGNFHGKICGLHITKSALNPGSMLHATDNQEIINQVAFHLSLDGESGDVATTLKARVGADGEASECSVQGGYPLVYDAGVPNKPRAFLVDDGMGNILGTNDSSVLLRPIPGTTFTQGPGVLVSGSSYERCDGGDFTLEAFVKHDWVTQTNLFDACSGTVARRFTIFGIGTGDAPDVVLFGYYQTTYKYWYYRLQAYDVTGTRKDVSWADSGLQKCFADGKWHHYALVYDDENRTFTFQVDYGTENGGYTFVSDQLPNPIGPRAGYEVVNRPRRDVVFGVGAGGGAMAGLVDEVRFSREKLTPAEFISFAKPKTGLMLLFR